MAQWQFIQKLTKIQNNIPITNIDPMDNFKKYVTKYEDEFRFNEINVIDLRLVISKLNNTKSTDIDGISMKFIKCIRSTIEPALIKLINLCFKRGEFPDVFKISKIIPLAKIKLLTDMNNFRPIHILSPLSTIIEKVMSLQITKYLK